MKIEIDDDAADDVVRAIMFDLYEILKDERHNLNQRREIRYKKRPRIHRIKKTLWRVKELKDFEKEDLEYNKTLLAAVITIIKHFTAHNNLPKELK